MATSKKPALKPAASPNDTLLQVASSIANDVKAMHTVYNTDDIHSELSDITSLLKQILQTLKEG